MVRLVKKSTNAESYQAPALKKGLEVLEFLAGQAEPYAVSELARALGKSRNEIYRMVIVLEQLGYLARTDADRFALTRKHLMSEGRRATQSARARVAGDAAPRGSDLAKLSSDRCEWSRYRGRGPGRKPGHGGFLGASGPSAAVESISVGAGVSAYQTAARRAAWQALLSSDKDRKLWAAIEHDVQSIRDMGFYLSPSKYVACRNRHRGSDYGRQERSGHRDPGHALYRRAFRQAESDASGHGDAASRPKNLRL